MNLYKNFNKENKKEESIDEEVNIQIDIILKRLKLIELKDLKAN